MFGAKARKIRQLEADFSSLEKSYANRVAESSRFQKELLELREAQIGLVADRDQARNSLAALAAERDQFAKRVEELEEKIREFIETPVERNSFEVRGEAH